MDETPSNVVLDFKGKITFCTISNLLPELKERVDKLGEKVNTYKRLLTITIEVLENCYRYIDNQLLLKPYQDNYPAFIRIIKDSDCFNIQAGNTILKEDIDIISFKLDKVNSLDEVGLRDLYKKTIANGQFSAVGGAGLGFIEISKACGDKISYNFKQIDGDIYFYTIMLDVKP
jgi:hypothetical protein